VRFLALTLLTLTALAGILSGCEDGSAAARDGERPPTEAAASATKPPAGSTRAAAPTGERPLPAFEGFTLTYDRVSISSFIGNRLLLFCFNPEVEEATPAAEAVASVAGQRGEYNFSVVGVAVGTTGGKAREFASKMGLDFPILDDSSGRITQRLGLQSPVSLIGVDAEGYMSFAVSRFDSEAPEPARGIEEFLREQMRLPQKHASASGKLDQRPIAPLFEAERMNGGEPLRLTDLEGQPLVLIFFLHMCPHCDKALHFFKEQIAKLPEEKRPTLAGISVFARPGAVREALAEKGLDFFPVLFDEDRAISEAYGVRGGVPDIFMIDRQRRIVFRSRGWDEDRSPALARMYLAQISDEKIPLLLNRSGYTGNDVCAICHQRDHDTWLYSRHAVAYDALVVLSQERNPECVGCHVVGLGEAGGFSIAESPAYLENVGCETCHGLGGGHLAPDFTEGEARRQNYEEICVKCHSPTHSLAFDYATFVQRISHEAVATMSDEERRALVAGRTRGRDLLPTDADYVGSDACKSCHEAEFATWLASPHGQALKSLESEQAAEKAECLPCHTTGFGLPGGFDASQAARNPPDLARVGCESCHGPGSLHVPENAERFSTTLSLGDKCDSCVILQVCGSCHDEDRDPGFEFHVMDKVEKQRHGTTRPGTSEPLAGSASPQPPDLPPETREES
jgi:peroxiredoxin